MIGKIEEEVNAIFFPLVISVHSIEDEIQFSGCGVQFRLSDKKMYIDSLSRCEPFSGTDLLERILAFAKIKGVTSIELDDFSYMKWCDFETSLAHFEIFVSGISWYNRFGFKSVNHERDVARNAKVREQLFDKIVDPFLLNEFKTNFPDIATDRKVKDVFQDIKRLDRDLGIEKCDTIENILSFFYFKIQYDNKLTRTGGKRKTRKRCKRVHRHMKSRSR